MNYEKNDSGIWTLKLRAISIHYLIYKLETSKKTYYFKYYMIFYQTELFTPCYCYYKQLNNIFYTYSEHYYVICMVKLTHSWQIRVCAFHLYSLLFKVFVFRRVANIYVKICSYKQTMALNRIKTSKTTFYNTKHAKHTELHVQEAFFSLFFCFHKFIF